MGFVSFEEIETVTVEAINCNGQRATMTVISAGFCNYYSLITLPFLQFSPVAPEC